MRRSAVCAAALLPLALPFASAAQAPLKPAWMGYGANAQHSAPAPALPQTVSTIHWTAAVDDAPQISGGELLIHYASAMITAANTVLLPVKGSAGGNFRIEARAGATGALLWKLATNYTLPPHDWTPPLPAVLTQQNVLHVAAAGGVVISRATPDATTGTIARAAFYGTTLYNSDAAAYNAAIQINTPLTADAAGNLYFGFLVSSGSVLKDAIGNVLKSGIARLTPAGEGSWVSASAAAGDATITHVAMNAAPAVSRDGKTIYVAVSNGSAGDLLALNSATLATTAKQTLSDPQSGWAAWVDDDSSASPVVGPDGDVFYGVLEQPFPEHNDRGWLLHFDGKLATLKTPGSFGWDNTPSVVPASSVPSYTGTSSYLLMSKYNNYFGVGTGNGLNQVAVIDPDTAAADVEPNVPSPQTLSPVQVMKPVLSVLGPSLFPGEGNARYEWCINSAVVDAKGGSTVANSEDGHLYHWSLKTGQITESLLLNAPRPEAYTMTVIGPDGTIYAINNATFYAVGK